MALVEIEGPGGRAKIAEKDVKAYLRRDGYKLAGTPKPPKKLSDADAAKAAEKAKDAAGEEDIEEVTGEDGGQNDAEAYAAEELKALLEDVKKMTTPQLELVVDEHDLGLALSRLNLVAERRDAVTKALKAQAKAEA